MSKLDDAKSVADSYLDEVVSTVEIRQAYTNIVVGMGGTIMGALQDQPSKSLVQRALRHSRTEASAVYRPLMVQVCSIFENYVRSLATAIIEERFETLELYENLSEGFRNDHITHAARVLMHVKKGHVMGSPYPFNVLLHNLGHGISGQKGYKLNPEIFTKLMGNPTSARLCELFETLALPPPFSDSLGQNAGLQAFFNERTRRRVAESAEKLLDQKLGRRNDIVHGDLTLVVDQTEIEQTLGFFRALIAALDQHVRS